MSKVSNTHTHLRPGIGPSISIALQWACPSVSCNRSNRFETASLCCFAVGTPTFLRRCTWTITGPDNCIKILVIRIGFGLEYVIEYTSPVPLRLANSGKTGFPISLRSRCGELQ